MKALAARLSLHRAVGLFLGEQEIYVSHVAATPLGPVEIARQKESYAPDDLVDVLQRLLRPLIAGKRRAVVAVGLPATRVFFATRSLRGSDGEASPEVLLQKALQSPSISVDDLIVDLVRSDVSKVPMATMAACRREPLSGLLASLAVCGVRPFCVEPGPCALARAAALQHRAPWRAKMVLRVFLCADQGLAVAIAGNLPLAWRKFVLPKGGEVPAILCATRTLRTLARFCGIESPLNTAMIHGRPDLHEQLNSAEFANEIGGRLSCYEGPGLDGPATAFGLALGGLKEEPRAFDLSRTLKPRVSIREIFPWGELVLQAGFLVCVGVVLAVRYMSLSDDCLAAKIANQGHKCLTAPRAELEKERKDLQEKVEAVRNFLRTRILWTDYMHDLPARLPTNARFGSLQGYAEMEYLGKKKESAGKPKRSFLLQASAPLSPAGGMPREIDVFLDALRNLPLLKRDFPNVELADIKRYRLAGFAPTANFTVICLPGADKVSNHSAAEDEAGQKKEKK